MEKQQIECYASFDGVYRYAIYHKTAHQKRRSVWWTGSWESCRDILISQYRASHRTTLPPIKWIRRPQRRPHHDFYAIM